MNHFDQHSMRRETGWTWRCNRPGTGTYGFRITFAPYSLMISGDIGDLIVNHYSFTDPWAAAAWVNGAGWDYLAMLYLTYPGRRSRVARERGLS